MGTALGGWKADRHGAHGRGKTKLNEYCIHPPLRSAILCHEGQGSRGRNRSWWRDLVSFGGCLRGGISFGEESGRYGTELGERSIRVCGTGGYKRVAHCRDCGKVCVCVSTVSIAKGHQGGPGQRWGFCSNNPLLSWVTLHSSAVPRVEALSLSSQDSLSRVGTVDSLIPAMTPMHPPLRGPHWANNGHF